MTSRVRAMFYGHCNFIFSFSIFWLFRSTCPIPPLNSIVETFEFLASVCTESIVISKMKFYTGPLLSFALLLSRSVQSECTFHSFALLQFGL